MRWWKKISSAEVTSLVVFLHLLLLHRYQNNSFLVLLLHRYRSTNVLSLNAVFYSQPLQCNVINVINYLNKSLWGQISQEREQGKEGSVEMDMSTDEVKSKFEVRVGAQSPQVEGRREHKGISAHDSLWLNCSNPVGGVSCY